MRTTARHLIRTLSILTLAAFPLLLAACAEEEPGLDEEVEAPLGDATVMDTDTNYFTDWDLDGDGYLNESEWGSGFETATWWDDWDVNSDEALDEAEFESAFGDRGWYNDGLFGEWDADGDQRLSSDEWEGSLYEQWDANDDNRLAENEYDSGLFS